MSPKKKRKYTKRRKSYSRADKTGGYSDRRYKGSGKASVFSKIFNSILAVLAISALILFIIVIIGKISESDKSISKAIMSKIFTTFQEKKKDERKDENGGGSLDEGTQPSLIGKEVLFKICIVSDIHQDLESLTKAGEKIKSSGCERIFVIGDLTNYGDVKSLVEVRDILSSFGIEYYTIPGDHDIAETFNVSNFNQVFGVNYRFIEYGGVRFMLIDNSPNFTVIDKVQMSWIQNNIDRADFVVISQPLYTEGLNPPFNITYMGSMLNTPEGDDMKEKQQQVLEQGRLLLDTIRKSNSVMAIFAGEHHRSSKIVDSVRSGLSHLVVGAVTSTVNNLPQSAIQTSRFSVLTIYEGKEYSVEDISID